MEELISVIVPVYNVEEFLPVCVESVLRQSYKNLELILVDDGSADSSGELCDVYAGKDERIRVVHKKNGGLSSARNAGLDICRGQYIFFLDSDDHIHENALEKLYGVMTGNGCDLVLCDFCSYDRGLGRPEQGGGVRFLSGKELLDQFFGFWHTHITVAWNKLYRRELIADTRFPEGLLHEDEAVVFSLIYKSAKIGWIREKLYRYRRRESSITGNAFSLKRLDILKAYEIRIAFYKEKGEAGLLSREELYYLSAILDNYGKVKRELPGEKSTAEDLKKLYRKKYKSADKHSWSIARRFSCFLFYLFPGMYGLIKRK